MPVAADPGRNPHRPGTGWTLGTVTTILANSRYTGRQVWNRQRTDRDLAGLLVCRSCGRRMESACRKPENMGNYCVRGPTRTLRT